MNDNLFLTRMRTSSKEHQKRVTHLLRRTQFGTTKKEVEELSKYSIVELVDRILSLPEEAPEAPLSEDDKEQDSLIFWWFGRLLNTKNPLQEKLTLFWHNHFTSSFEVSNIPSYMAVQNMLLRKHALGNFQKFTYDISIDPAMLLWLSGESNIKAEPNENYARELLELFTVGIGHYTQKDIEELARALTGWKVNTSKEAIKVRQYFESNDHDDELKTIFDITKNYNMKSAVDLIVDLPACPEYITKKIWSKFVSPTPSNNEIREASQVFKASSLNIKELLRYLFTSEAFYSEKAYHSIVKDPLEFAIEIIKKYPTYSFNKDELYRVMLMGMELMRPPNVAGWNEGVSWVHSNLFFARGEFASKATEAVTYESLGIDKSNNKTEMVNQLLDIIGLFDISDNTKKQLIDYAESVFDANTLLRGVLYLANISPEAQMK